MRRRVVVTGLGAVTPIGNTAEQFWEACKEGKIGIGPITKFDTADYKVKLAAEVKDFDPKEYMDSKTARRMEAFCQFAVAAAVRRWRILVFRWGRKIPIGSESVSAPASEACQAMEREHSRLLAGGPRRVGPMLVPLMISNMAAGNTAIQLGCKGKCINVVTACATGTHSIGEAFRSIQYGEADMMLAGGTEASITPIGVAGFSALTALSPSEDPQRASIPFDRERNGFVMGEGAGVVMLEELEHAKARNAHIYAELVGYGATCDAYHITSPAEDGSGAARAMTEAMKDAGVTPEMVDYINAHGTSTHHNDLFETRAIHLAMGDAAENVKISSTKSMVGHLLGAAGGVEFIACVKSIEDQCLHGTAGYREADEECDLNYLVNGCEKAEVDVVLSNSLGFGGHNATLCVRKYKE